MRCAALVMVLTLCLASAPALAQEHGQPSPSPESAGHEAAADAHSPDGGHGAKYELLSIDGMTAIWTIIVFVVLLIVLRAAAWKPIQQALVQRERFIRDSLNQAKQDREQAETRLKEIEERLSNARAEASGIVEEGRRDADVLRRKIEQDARNEADAMLERAKREIGVARDTAVKELYEKTALLATETAARIIKKEIDPAHHEQLIAESIEQLTRPGGNGR